MLAMMLYEGIFMSDFKTTREHPITAEQFIIDNTTVSTLRNNPEISSVYFAVLQKDIAEAKAKGVDLKELAKAEAEAKAKGVDFKQSEELKELKEKYKVFFNSIQNGFFLYTEKEDKNKAIEQLTTMHELFSIVGYNEVNHLDVLRTLLRLLMDEKPTPDEDKILKFAQELISVSNLGNYKSGKQDPEQLIADIRLLKSEREKIYAPNKSVEDKLKESKTVIIDRAARIFESCVKEVFGENTPKYSMEILGSFAKGEGTPLSDIEYALVLGEGVNKEKMLEAAELFYNRVRNYGESTGTAFTLDNMTVGFTMDEKIRPNKQPGYSYIGTVEELLNDIDTHSSNDGAFVDISPYLQSEQVSGDQGLHNEDQGLHNEDQGLHNDFDSARKAKLEEKKVQISRMIAESLRGKTPLKKLIDFLEEYKSGGEPSHSFDVKELARAPAFLARYLELKYGIFCNNTDQLLINLQKEKKISPDQLQVLQRILEIARTFRLDLQDEHNFDNHDAGGSKINKDNVAELLGLCIQLKNIIKIKTELDPLIESIEENLRVEQRLKKSINNHMTGNDDRKRRINVIEDALKKLNELKPVSAENIRDFKKNLSNIISTLEKDLKPKDKDWVQKGREWVAGKSQTVTNMIPDIKEINGYIEKIINNLDFVVENEDKVKSELKEDDDSFVVVNEYKDEVEPDFKEIEDGFVMMENLKTDQETDQESLTPETDPLLSKIPTERPINGKKLPTSPPLENENNLKREGSRQNRYTHVSEDAITTPSQAEINRAKFEQLFSAGEKAKDPDPVATSLPSSPPIIPVTFSSKTSPTSTATPKQEADSTISPRPPPKTANFS